MENTKRMTDAEKKSFVDGLVIHTLKVWEQLEFDYNIQMNVAIVLIAALVANEEINNTQELLDEVVKCIQSRVDGIKKVQKVLEENNGE